MTERNEVLLEQAQRAGYHLDRADTLIKSANAIRPASASDTAMLSIANSLYAMGLLVHCVFTDEMIEAGIIGDQEGDGD